MRTSLLLMLSPSKIVLADDFSTDTSATYTSVGTPTISVVSGELSVVNNGAVSSQARKAFNTVIGATYRIDVIFRRVTGTAVVRARTSAGALLVEITSVSTVSAAQSVSFVATTASSFIDLGNGATTTGNEARFDSYTIRRTN